MELEGNPGSALRETINALDGMTAALMQDQPGKHAQRKRVALALVRRFNDLLTRCLSGLEPTASDREQRELQAEIARFLRVEGYGPND